MSGFLVRKLLLICKKQVNIGRNPKECGINPFNYRKKQAMSGFLFTLLVC